MHGLGHLCTKWSKSRWISKYLSTYLIVIFLVAYTRPTQDNQREWKCLTFRCIINLIKAASSSCAIHGLFICCWLIATHHCWSRWMTSLSKALSTQAGMIVGHISGQQKRWRHKRENEETTCFPSSLSARDVISIRLYFYYSNLIILPILKFKNRSKYMMPTCHVKRMVSKGENFSEKC